MAPSETYPSWNQSRVGEHRAYPEQESPSWVVISEVSRPAVAPRAFEQYPKDRMNREYEYGHRSPHLDGPIRMFDGPIGPSPEEDINAPFYVPRNRTPPTARQMDFRGVRGPRSPPLHHLAPFRDDEDVHWRSRPQMDEYQSSHTDRDCDPRSLYRASRNMPHDRKLSNFPYPKQPMQRDRSRERHAASSIPRVRRHNGYAQQGRHRRKTSSINLRQNSRETSVSNSSQYSHDDAAPARPLSRPGFSPQSNFSQERELASPKSLPQSPIMTPSILGRSWNGTPPPKTEESISQAISVLNQMLERQSLEQILHLWRSTGQGPNPFDFPQWEGWRDPLPLQSNSLSPRTMRGEVPWAAQAHF